MKRVFVFGLAMAFFVLGLEVYSTDFEVFGEEREGGRVSLADQEPAFEPRHHKGTGDDVLNVDVPNGEPYLLFVQGNAAERHFAVTGYDAQGNRTQLFVNTTKRYSGITLDSRSRRETSVLEIKASGGWSIELRAIQDTEVVKVPGTLKSRDDRVFIVDGNPSTVRVVGNKQERYFAVAAYEVPLRRGRTLVNTTDQYEGRSRISSEAELIVVSADGEWEATLE